jgi:hypothetical protein
LIAEVKKQFSNYNLTGRNSKSAGFTSAQKPLSPETQTNLKSLEKTFEVFHPSTIKPQITSETFCKQNKTQQNLFKKYDPIIPLRRISSIQDNFEKGNYEKAAIIALLAAVNIPEDFNDLRGAYMQMVQKKVPKYDFKNCQHAFSFFRGTWLVPMINKLGKFGAKLYELDKSLYNTHLGRFVRKTLKVKRTGKELTGRIDYKLIVNKKGFAEVVPVKVVAQRLEGSVAGKLICRAMLRIPVLSLLVIGLMEAPGIIKEFKHGAKAGLMQVAKSGISIATMLSFISITGSLLSRKGPAYSVLGVGVGAIIGSAAAQNINEKLFTAKKNDANFV